MLPNVLTNALIPMRYYVTLNTLLGISRVTLHITTDPKLLLSLNRVTTKMKLIKRMTMTLMTIIATAIMTARATI